MLNKAFIKKMLAAYSLKNEVAKYGRFYPVLNSCKIFCHSRKGGNGKGAAGMAAVCPNKIWFVSTVEEKI